MGLDLDLRMTPLCMNLTVNNVLLPPALSQTAIGQKLRCRPSFPVNYNYQVPTNISVQWPVSLLKIYASRTYQQAAKD